MITPRKAPSRGPRARTDVEHRFLELGEAAEAFIRSGAAAGMTMLPKEIDVIVNELLPAHGDAAVTRALERAVRFSRFRADIRSILAIGPAAPEIVDAGDPVVIDLPAVEQRRLKLAAIRHAAPEILLTAKTQRWKPEETLRVLIDLELAARDESNCRNRMAAAKYPVHKTLDVFNVAESSIPAASHDYLITLDWIDRADNLCLVGPAGTGKTHYLIASGRAAVQAGHRVLNSPEVHRLLVRDSGWAPERFQAWLAETLTTALLRPTPAEGQ